MGIFSKLFAPATKPATQPANAPQMPATRRPTSPRTSGGVIERASVGVPPSTNASPTFSFGSGYFEALRITNDRTPVPVSPFYLAPYLPFLSFNRNQLAALGRYLYDNHGAVGYAVNLIANYSAPVMPEAATADPDWNESANKYFQDWTAIADYTGRFDFKKLQRIACKQIDTDGDVGFAATKESGIVQLQTFEGWQIGPMIPKPQPDIMDGVRIDAGGKVMSYLIGLRNNETIELPASQFCLLYDADRFLQYRGLSPIRRGSNDIRDAQDIKAFTKLATKIGAALGGVIESDGPIEEDDWGNDSGSGDGGQAGNMPASSDQTFTPQQKKLSVAELLGGDIPVIDNGKFHQLENKRPSSNEVDLIDTLGGWFVLGLDLPPAFFLDTKLTGPNLRAVIGKAQRKFNQRVEMLARLARFAWVRVIGDAIASGALPSIDCWACPVIQPPPLATIDLGDQMSNEREDVQNALMSRRNHYGNRSLNWQIETDQIDAEQNYIFAKAAATSKKFGVPIEIVLSAYGFQQTVRTTIAADNSSGKQPQNNQPAKPNQ